MAGESKTHMNTSKGQESEHEKSETNDDTTSKTRSIKPNNLPASFLILAIILANLQVSTGMKCPKASDIKWMSNRTNKLVGCTSCQSCPPSQEFSIPCGTEAYIGTVAECSPCPSGKFSDGFNTKPCVSCTRCSNRVVKQNCTLFRNSVCGDCKPGYYLENTLFGCIKCAKCCNDGRDETHASCSLLNLCKIRPNGCPIMPTKKLVATPFTSSKASTSSGKTNPTPWSSLIKKSFPTPKFNNQTLRPIDSSGIGQSDIGMIETTAVYENNKPRPIASPTTQQSTKSVFINVHNPWFIVGAVLLTVAVIVLIVFVILLTIKFKKMKKSHKSGEGCVESAEYKPVSQDPNSTQIELKEDQTLEQFMQDNYNAVDEICKLLVSRNLGQFDFERLALEWKIPKDDIQLITSEIHAQEGSPVRKLLDVLCAQRRCTTVRQLADSIKKINNKAYEILKPHLLKPREAD